MLLAFIKSLSCFTHITQEKVRNISEFRIFTSFFEIGIRAIMLKLRTLGEKRKRPQNVSIRSFHYKLKEALILWSQGVDSGLATPG